MNTQESADTRIVDPARLPFAYADALNAGDAEAVLALFHQDATMRTFTGEVLGDREALRAETVNSIAAQARLTNKPRFTQIGGDTALIIVDWNLEATLPDGTRISPTGTTTAVARQSADGRGGSPSSTVKGQLGLPGGGQQSSPLVDGRSPQAGCAAFASSRSTRTPFWNRVPARTRATRWGALTAGQRSWADSMSLNVRAKVAARDPARRVTLVRSRTDEKVDSMGFVVRRWIQCSAG
jgi:uncharacterized protein (TIGR02246 family)